MNRKIILLPLSVAALLVLGACGKTTTSSAAPVSSAATTSSSKKEAAPTAITVADLITWNAAQDATAITVDGDTLFTMSGILEGWAGATGTDDYGDCYLTDPTTLKSVLVYGSTTTKTCIAGDAGSYAFTNPKDAKTTLAEYKNGEKATMTFIRECYKGKLEILGYFTAHVADTTKYTASVATGIENGTIALDKTSGLGYGDTVTVTATPATDYAVDAVKVTTSYGNIVATKTADNTFTFPATCVNTVTATFKSTALPKKSIPSANLIAGKASGDAVSIKAAKVFANVNNNLLICTETGTAMVNIFGKNLTITIGAFYDVVGSVGDINTSSALGILCIVPTTVTATAAADLPADYEPTFVGKTGVDYSSADGVKTYLQSLVAASAADLLTTFGTFVTYTNVYVSTGSSSSGTSSSYFQTVAGTANNTPKSATNAKTVSLAFYKVDLPSDFSATQKYNVTVFVGGVNKTFADTSNNTIIRCYYGVFTKVAA